MNARDMIEMVERFERAYGVNTLEQGMLDDQGYGNLRDIFETAGYSAIHPIDADGCELKNDAMDAIWVRHNMNGIELVVERDLETLEKGLTYRRFENLTQVETFRQKYSKAVKDYLNDSNAEGTIVGGTIGLSLVVVSTFVYVMAANVPDTILNVSIALGTCVLGAGMGGTLGYLIGGDARENEHKQALRKMQPYLSNSKKGISALRNAVLEEVDDLANPVA